METIMYIWPQLRHRLFACPNTVVRRKAEDATLIMLTYADSFWLYTVNLAFTNQNMLFRGSKTIYACSWVKPPDRQLKLRTLSVKIKFLYYNAVVLSSCQSARYDNNLTISWHGKQFVLNVSLFIILDILSLIFCWLNSAINVLCERDNLSCYGTLFHAKFSSNTNVLFSRSSEWLVRLS